jgi:hypothetical protein
MFTVAPFELLSVREALQDDPLNYGVGLLHLDTSRIVLRPFNDVCHRGGHLELVNEHAWLSGECFGFIVAKPEGTCVLINQSQLNVQAGGGLAMPKETFRNIVLGLRECWAEMTACESFR